MTIFIEELLSCVMRIRLKSKLLSVIVKKALLLFPAVLVLALILSQPVFCQSFKAGTEPRGFQQLKWETEVSKIKGMEFVKEASMGGSYPPDLSDPEGNLMTDKILIYARDSDKLRFGGAVLKSIRYGFCDGKLCEVTLTAKGSKNWDALKKETFHRFGSKRSVMPENNPFMDNHLATFQYYMWQGKVSEMELMYNSSAQVSELWVGSVVAKERIFDAARQKKRGQRRDKGG